MLHFRYMSVVQRSENKKDDNDDDGGDGTNNDRDIGSDSDNHKALL